MKRIPSHPPDRSPVSQLEPAPTRHGESLLKACAFALSLFLLAVAAPVGAETPGAPPPEAKEAMSLGLEAAKEKDWKAAIKHFEAARKFAPYAPPVLFNLAIAHDSIIGHEFSAIAFYRAFLAVTPNFKNAEKIRKRILGLKEKIEGYVLKMVDVAERMARAFPPGTLDRRLAFKEMAPLRAAVGDLPSALAIMDDEFESDDDRQSVLTSIGRIQANSGDVPGVRNTAKQLKDQRWVSFIYEILAKTQARAGDISGALETTTDIKALKGQNEQQRQSLLVDLASTYSSIGSSLINAGDIKQAKKMVLRIKRLVDSLNPTAKDTERVYGSLISLWIETDFTAAWAFAESIKEDKLKDQAFNVIANRLAWAGDVAKARQALAKTKKIAPWAKSGVDLREQHQKAVEEATNEKERRIAERELRRRTRPLGWPLGTNLEYSRLPFPEKEAQRWLFKIPQLLYWPGDNFKEFLQSLEKRLLVNRVSGIASEVGMFLLYLRQYRNLAADLKAHRQAKATGSPK